MRETITVIASVIGTCLAIAAFWAAIGFPSVVFSHDLNKYHQERIQPIIQENMDFIKLAGATLFDVQNKERLNILLEEQRVQQLPENEEKNELLKLLRREKYRIEQDIRRYERRINE